MDKIDFSKWDNYFGNTQHLPVYANDRYTESIFHFAEEGLPTGKVKTISTPGLTLIELDINSSKPFQFLDLQEEEAAESLFVLAGNVESNFDAYKEPLRFTRQNQSIQYNPDFSGTHRIQAGKFHALTISYDLDFLGQLLQSAAERPLRTLSDSIRHKQSFLPKQYSMAVSGRIAEVIHNIQTCPFVGVTRYIFIESKMMELFALQMEQLHMLQDAKPDHKWSQSDQVKLHAVKEFIGKAFLEPLSLKELTLKFGLNEFKLKKGYKDLFHTTVFGHIHQLRMQKARTLLKEREMNVSDVAFFIGYDNVSSFSTEFKKRFGCTPRMAS